MSKFAFILVAFLLTTAALRADLTLVQQAGNTNRTYLVTIKVHGNKMRMDQPDQNLGVIVDLNTRDSFTLITSNKTFLQRFGSEVRWQMSEEKKHFGGTNEIDNPPARAVDTGKSETINGYSTTLYTWSGAYGLKEILWVAKQYPSFNTIRTELTALDRFNDSGPHRNGQPFLSLLPGMVIKSESDILGHTATNTLVSANTDPLDPSLFKLPADYTAWKRPATIHPETNSPPAK